MASMLSPSSARSCSVRPTNSIAALNERNEERRCKVEACEGDGDGVQDDSQDELDNIVLVVQDASPAEREAMRAYVEATKKAKFLYDGENMIKIKPKRTMALKAAFGKAYWLHQKLKDKRRANIRFDGYLWDYLPKSGYKIPSIVSQVISEIEVRDTTRNGIYVVGACPDDLRKIRKAYLRGKTPNVRQ